VCAERLRPLTRYERAAAVLGSRAEARTAGIKATCGSLGVGSIAIRNIVGRTRRRARWQRDGTAQSWSTSSPTAPTSALTPNNILVTTPARNHHSDVRRSEAAPTHRMEERMAKGLHRVLLVALMSSVALCGCDSGRSEPSSSVDNGGSPTANDGLSSGPEAMATIAQSPDTTPQAASPSDPHGLVVITCGGENDHVSVSFLQPESGIVMGQRSFNIQGTQPTLDGCDGWAGTPQALTRAFDSTFSRLAVTLPGQDQGSDVGYVTSDGSVTDVTAARGPVGDFQNSARDTLPTFRPGTSELWFDHSGAVVSVIAGGDEKNLVPHPSIQVYSPGDEPDDLGVDASGTEYLPPFVPISDAGTQWAGYLENDESVAALPICKSGACQTGYDSSEDDGYGIYPPGGINGGNFDIKKPLALYPFKAGSAGDGCEPAAWLTDTSWLCIGGGQGGGEIGVAKVDSRGLLEVSFPIPFTEGRQNSDPVLSPDHASIAFRSCRSGLCSIYTVPVDGSAQPTKVIDEPSGTLVEWLP